jgi:chromosome segregation ATPase
MTRKLLKYVVIFASTALIFLSGCREAPEDKAAKQARAANAKALAMLQVGDDVEDVRKELKKALAGKAGPSAALISADLSFDEATQSQAGLVTIRLNTIAVLDTISTAFADVRESELEQYRLRKLLTAGDKQIAQLEDMLEGAGELQPGLRTKLQNLQTQSDELLKERELLQRRLDEARQRAAELQRRANNLLRVAAGQADEKEKELLQQQAYDLLKGGGETSAGKTDWLAKAQEIMDKISDVDSELALTIPRIEKLTEDIASAQKRIEDIESSENRSLMKARLRNARSGIDDGRRQVRKLLDQLAATENNYGQVVDKVVESFGKAGKEYAGAGSSADGLIGNIAAMSQADCFYRIGRVNEECMKLQDRLARRLELLAGAEQAGLAGDLRSAARDYSGDIDKYGDKASDNYDGAVKIYEKLHKRLGRKKNELAGSVTTNYILVLCAKARLAELLGPESLRAEALEQAQKLAEQAAELDPGFEKSITATLLQDLK